MSFRIVCPGCKASFQAADELRGKRVRCRECDKLLNLSAPTSKPELEEAVYDPAQTAAPAVAAPSREAPARPGPPPPPRSAGGPGLLIVALAGGGLALGLGVLIVFGVVTWVLLARSPAAPMAEGDVVAHADIPPPNALPAGGGFGLPPLLPPVLTKPGLGARPAENDPAPGGPVGPVDAAMVQRVKRSTAHLRVSMANGQRAEGSGFFAVEPGIVITNAHVLGMLSSQSQPPTSVEVVVNGGEADELTLKGEVLGVDRGSDLAVVRVPDDAKLPPPLPVAPARTLAELQDVFIFGFPFGSRLGKNITVSKSSVSSLRKAADGSVVQLQVNGGMHPGNSGGPVVDAKGNVVGVSVAIIRGTQINFAVPGEFVLQVVEGRLVDMVLGEPFIEEDQVRLPVRMRCLDPLGRIQGMSVEVWTGENGPPRPHSSHPPAALPGDSPRDKVPAKFANGAGTADVPLPALDAGRVYWVQAVYDLGPAGTRWAPVPPLAQLAYAPLERRTVPLVIKAQSQPLRTLGLKKSARVSTFEGKEKLSEGIDLEADVLEVLTKDKRGTGTRLHFGEVRYSQIVDDRKASANDPQVRQALRQASPNFLVAPNGKLQERGDPATLKAAQQREVESLYNHVCNTYEAVSLYVPNRSVDPLETWTASVPMLVTAARGKTVRRADIELTCRYEGTRRQDNRLLAFVSLDGVMKGREKGMASAGKVSGRALFDIEFGYIAHAHLTFSTDLDAGGSQLFLTSDIDLTRIPGNPLNIQPRTK